MADISTILKNNGSIKQPKEKGNYEVTMIHYSQIKPSKMQFYRQEDIEEQADAIELAGGIMQPLVVRQQDADQYELLAGHRRLEAVKRLVEERKLTQYAMVPCHVEQANDWRAEYLLITTNGYREKTGYEKMLEIQRLSEIIPHLPGSEELKGRALRGRIAKELKTGETSVQNYNYIYNHLCSDGMEAFKVGEIKTAVANELAHLDEEDQKILLQSKGLTSAVIAEYVRNKSCQTLTQESEEKDTQQNIPVSNFDIKKDSFTEVSKNEHGKETIANEKEMRSEEEIARKMIARYVKWAPERMKEVIAICNTCDTNKGRAQRVQKYLAPNGYSGGGSDDFDFCFRGYANGVSFELDKNRLSMSYIKFVKHLEDMFGPFATSKSAEAEDKNANPVTDKENEDTNSCEEKLIQKPTKAEQVDILRAIIDENQEMIQTMEDYWSCHMPQELWKHQLMLQAAEKLLNELQSDECNGED